MSAMDNTYSSAPSVECDALRQRYFLPSVDIDASSRRKSRPSASPVQYLALAATTKGEGSDPIDPIPSQPAHDTFVIDFRASLLTMPPEDPTTIAPTSLAAYDGANPGPVKEAKVSSSRPSRAALDKAADLTVYNTDGIGLPFKSLYWAEPGHRRRVMIIFIRHFFCGVGQLNFTPKSQPLISHVLPELPGVYTYTYSACSSYFAA